MKAELTPLSKYHFYIQISKPSFHSYQLKPKFKFEFKFESKFNSNSNPTANTENDKKAVLRDELPFTK